MYDINAFGTLKNVLSISSFICAPARPGFPKIHLRTQYSLEKGLTPRVKTRGFEVDTATPAYEEKKAKNEKREFTQTG